MDQHPGRGVTQTHGDGIDASIEPGRLLGPAVVVGPQPGVGQIGGGVSHAVGVAPLAPDVDDVGDAGSEPLPQDPSEPLGIAREVATHVQAVVDLAWSPPPGGGVDEFGR